MNCSSLSGKCNRYALAEKWRTRTSVLNSRLLRHGFGQDIAIASTLLQILDHTMFDNTTSRDVDVASCCHQLLSPQQETIVDPHFSIVILLLGAFYMVSHFCLRNRRVVYQDTVSAASCIAAVHLLVTDGKSPFLVLLRRLMLP